MKKEEITQSNKLIAEFMDIPIVEHDGMWYNPENVSMEFNYHISWDWLMPVIEKIENSFNGEIHVIIEDESCEIRSHIGKTYNKTAYMETKILAAWHSVIEFINWYNKNK